MLRVRVDINGKSVYTITATQKRENEKGWRTYEWGFVRHEHPPKKIGGYVTHLRSKGALQLIRIILLEILDKGG